MTEMPLEHVQARDLLSVEVWSKDCTPVGPLRTVRCEYTLADKRTPGINPASQVIVVEFVSKDGLDVGRIDGSYDVEADDGVGKSIASGCDATDSAFQACLGFDGRSAVFQQIKSDDPLTLNQRRRVETSVQ